MERGLQECIGRAVTLYPKVETGSSERTEAAQQLAENSAHFSGPYGVLNHPIYDEYARMHKMILDASSAEELERVGDSLSREEQYRFLDTAGSAYVESMLARSQSLPVEEKYRLIDQAEFMFEKSMHNQELLWEHELRERDSSDIYRSAVWLACMPMLRSFAAGNVTESVIESTLTRLIAIAETSIVQLDIASRDGRSDAVAEHIGLQHEINAMVALMHQKDPRFIAIPSSERAGTGYYHQDQTHDLVLISQHYGQIRNAIPIEIKAAASRRDRDRYRALIIRGKMHLAVDGKYQPRYVTEMFSRNLRDEATKKDEEHLSTIRHNIHELTARYKRGGKCKDLHWQDSPTSYYNADVVASMYAA